MAPKRSPNRAPATSMVAIACWLDLLGYGEMMDTAQFDPTHPKAQKPLSRLRAFQRVVAEHSSVGFPSLVMNDGAVAYSSVDFVRSDKIWRFIQRCWQLYQTATSTDHKNGGPGLRAVIAVGLRAKGSNRGILAQEVGLAEIIEALASGVINKQEALVRARRVRRVFDVVPQLQANFAFTRAYEAEQAGSRAGLPGPNIYLDTNCFKAEPPSWMDVGLPTRWLPKRPSLTTSFVAIKEISLVPTAEANAEFANGREILNRLRRQARPSRLDLESDE